MTTNAAKQLRARIDPTRVIAQLDELALLTGDEGGAQRLCWSPTWMRALDWYRGLLEATGAVVSADPAGNLWGILEGQRPGLVVLGSHLDSVPNGGRLDGAYGALAALELLRAAASGAAPPLGIAAVVFADEEGARFGPSLGASGLTGTANPDWAELTDQSGVTLHDAARACGVEVERANTASTRLRDIRAYLELHIEQGPALEHSGQRLAVVTSTVAMRRERFLFEGTPNHAAATPMELRHDALAAAAEAIGRVGRVASAVPHATGTVAELRVLPNVWSVTARLVDLIVDMRAPEDDRLADMFTEVHEAATEICAALGVRFRSELIRQHTSQPFDAQLVALAENALRQVGSAPNRLLSCAMHDATVLASAVPAVMLFVPSRGGVSHVPDEDTSSADLNLGVEALAALADLVLEEA